MVGVLICTEKKPSRVTYKTNPGFGIVIFIGDYHGIGHIYVTVLRVLIVSVCIPGDSWLRPTTDCAVKFHGLCLPDGVRTNLDDKDRSM